MYTFFPAPFHICQITSWTIALLQPQPVTNNNPWMLLYFISFLLIVSFFVLNMFVGVVVENFHKCRQHQEVEEAKRREEKRQRRMEKKRRSKSEGWQKRESKEGVEYFTGPKNRKTQGEIYRVKMGILYNQMKDFHSHLQSKKIWYKKQSVWKGGLSKLILNIARVIFF